jgi:peptidoglycan/LPS O-acetylase OafA/YrhL
MQALRALWSVAPGRNASLDGLRGLAILLVVASHASAGRFPLGGMVGVTLFFVLSGYLITTLLLAERRDRGSVDLRAFYMRRALRLAPALVLLLIVTPLLLLLLQDPHLDGRMLPASAITALYLSDFFRAGGDTLVDYGHTWSLAVEEQYYLVWPALLLLVLARWLPRRRLWAAVLLLALLFAAWRLYAALTFGFDRVYFALDTNAFALLLGALLAVRPVTLGTRSAQAAAIVAPAGLLVVAILPVGNSGAAYLEGLTLGAVLVGAMALVAVMGARARRWPWSFRPLVVAGRLSYGLYLWHEVLYLSTPGGHALEGVWRAAAVVAAAVLALLSWTLVEYPMLQWKRRFERVRNAIASPVASSAQGDPASPAAPVR